MKQYRVCVHVESHDSESDVYADGGEPEQVGPAFESEADACALADRLIYEGPLDS